MIHRRSLAIIFAIAVYGSSISYADEIAASALATMPVREITVFKDGHAFVLHEGDLAPDSEGNVQLNYLPTPVIGTFWPYCSDSRATLVAASAGRTKINMDRPALQLRELLEANIGAQVLIHEADKTYFATIVDVPAREPKEDQPIPPDGSVLPRELGQVILLKTENGTKAINVDMIRDVTFTEEPRRQITDYEYRNLLKLRLDWKGQQPAEQVRVGMTYLQKGIRWIPEYRITVQEDGQAKVELQATLINELADLNDVKAHLVVGVPTFSFKDTIDPIALTQAVNQLSSYFQQPSQTAAAFSNSIMLQTQSRMGEVRAQQPAETGPELPGTDSTEDLFIFTVEHISLKRGERMVVSIGSWTVPYQDRFTLHIPYTPPPEVRSNHIESQQQLELAKLLYSPKVQHQVRLRNELQVPFTTAPAMLLSGEGRILGQGMMTYAAPGGASDITITTAVNIAVTHRETEKQRTPNAMAWGGYNFDRLDMNGVIRLTSFLNEPVQVEIVRETLGEIDSADNDANVEKLGPYGSVNEPAFGRWDLYSWPAWWRHVASISRARWELTLQPRESVELKYDWHYFWAW